MSALPLTSYTYKLLREYLATVSCIHGCASLVCQTSYLGQLSPLPHVLCTVPNAAYLPSWQMPIQRVSLHCRQTVEETIIGTTIKQLEGVTEKGRNG